ncbi:GGDEF domain-containing protein [Campylobacter sp. RM9344]|uniref:diguanylate cyclase n=2 Tax=Campylobacter TaxID=194 RepID=A0AAW3ZRX5_9BACT|nr:MULTISPECIES: bacteriohemerythrin [unclassified Campylobacter]MBE2985501.1 GGDEF domain-containing protein [Campylobacter sp. RM6883]MBE2986172.1 GGDEF domain-containing protein [Campylobacter sp. RM12919]MBE2987584.1 GGDEF domain-containing protein [Campylobacter sp. RM12920]MBE2996036.1 GGDEF domain-containing protein [Campylobacter sp. RM6913]MBE3030067.1 GGDEF domain-containing protein [Campylobacter sp. RM9344]
MGQVFFTWGKEFATNIEIVDIEHKYLVDIVNNLGNKLSKPTTTDQEIKNILVELIEYSKYHFAHEESIMQKSNIDKRHVKQHLAAHKNFIKEISLQEQKLGKKYNKENVKKLLDFLIQWLTFHILGIDKNLATQIHLIELGCDPKDAYIQLDDTNKEQVTTLLRSFNNIVNVLMKYNEELLVLKKSLEEKVESRTKELVNMNLMLESIAMKDQLTGIANRHKAMLTLDKLIKKFQKTGEKFSIIMLDIDNFKFINDTYGHDAGDRVMVAFADTLQHNIRNDDMACRLGGDEFLIICPKTDKIGCYQFATKIHKAILQIRINFHSSCWYGSTSIGISTYDNKELTKEGLIKIADNGVYQAKKQGKNRVCCFDI